MDAPLHEPSRARRILKRSGKIAGYTVLGLTVGPVALVTLLFLLLTIKPIRDFAVKEGIAYTNTLLGGYTVKVESIDRIDPWGVNVRGAQMFDDKQRKMLDVPWLMARLKPWSLIHNTLTLTQVEIDGVRFHLYPSDPNEPQKPKQPDDGKPSTFVVRAHHARVRSAEAVLEVAGRTLTAVVGTLAVGGQYGPKPALAIKEANVKVSERDQVLVRLKTTEGAWDANKGGRVGIEAQIVDAHLALSADLPDIDHMEPWPIKTAALQLDNVTRRTLDVAGVNDGAGLQAPVALKLDAKSTGQKLRANLRVLARERNFLALHASADDASYDLSLAILPTQLKALATLLPDLKVQGNLLAHATHGEDRMPKKVDLHWAGIAVNDGSFPNGALKAELPLPVVRLNSLKLDGLEQQFALHGEYDTKHNRGSGAVEFDHLQLDSIQLLQKQGLAGLLDGGLKADVTTQKLAADGRLTVRDFKHPSAQVGALDLALAVTGTLVAPLGHFNLAVDRLAAGDVKLERFTADALATPRTLSGKFAALGPDTNMKMEIGGQRGSDGSLRVQGIGRGAVKKREVRFDLRELHYRHDDLSVQELALFTGKQSVVVNGSLDHEQRIEAALKLANVDLSDWAKTFNLQGLEGIIAGDAVVGGTTREPRVDAKLHVSGVKYQSDQPIDGTIEVKGDLATRKADLNVGLYSSSELGARVTASVAIPKKPAALDKAMLDARVDAEAHVFMPVGQISALAGDAMAGLDGMLDAQLKASGTLDNPKLDTEINARLKLPEQTGDPDEGLQLTAKVDKEHAVLSVWAEDERGQLVSVDGELTWPGGSPRAALQRPDALRDANFQLALSLVPRRLDTMQGVFAYFTKIYAMSLPIAAGAKVTLKGEQGKLGGAAELHATVFGDKLDGRCKLGTTSAVDLDLKLDQDRVDVKIGAKTDGGGAISGELSSHLALNALQGGQPTFGPAKVTVEGQNIAIYKLPGLCNLASGSASFKAVAEGLGNDKPTAQLKAKIDRLSALQTEAMDVELEAKASERQAELQADFKSRSHKVGAISGSVPLSYDKGSNTPTVKPDAPLKAHVQFDKLLLANVLSFTESLGRINGDMSADIDVTGKLNEPYPKGYVQLDNVNLSVASLAQPLHDLNARLEVSGWSAKLEKLSARDRGGKLDVKGYANLQRDFSGDGAVYLETTRFPLRQQGTVIGELTTHARFDIKIPKNLQAQAQLQILGGRIWLTGDRGKDVQNLDAHPDIRFIDEKTDSDTTAEADKEGHPGLVISQFGIKTTEDLWLEHADFAIEVGVDIKLTQDPKDGPKLNGAAKLDRGELKLLGKSFRIKDGSIKFTGDMPPDPELDIKATFQPPVGQPLIVAVSGRGSAPNVEFSGAATNAGDALSVLSGRQTSVNGMSTTTSNSANTDASSQMAGIASNMTAGLLVMSARRRFGDWVPMISINTGAGGEPNGASAGFDASKLIPGWAKGFARSAYVEGMIGQQNGGAAQGMGGGAMGLGVKLEVALPKNLVTDLGYGPGSSWSTDLAWSP